MADHTSSKKRRAWPVLLGGLLLVLVLLVVLLPTLVSWGIGQGLIRNAINANINGEVKFASLRTGWFGAQSLKGLQVIHTDGTEAANVDVTVQAGLLQIITKRPGPLEVSISGKVKGEVRENGSISFKDLAKPTPAGSSQTPSPKSGGPFDAKTIPPVTLNITGLTLDLANKKTKQTLLLDKLTGAVSYTDVSQPVTIALTGSTVTNGVPGSVKINGTAADMFGADGAVTLKGASVKLETQIESMPLPLAIPGVDAPTQITSLKADVVSDDLTARIACSADVNLQIEGQPASTMKLEAAATNLLSSKGELTFSGATANLNIQATNLPIRTDDVRGFLQQASATVVSNDLTKTIVIAVDSRAELEGHAASTLTASLSIDELLTSDGKVTFAPERITGTVQGATIPTALAQPMLAKTPIVISRDLGPVMDFNASFSQGVEKEISLTAIAAGGRIEAKARANTANVAGQAILGTHLLIDLPSVHPELVQGFTGMMIDRPAAATVVLTSFAIPPADATTKSLSLAQVAATGAVDLKTPLTLTLPAQPEKEPIALAVREVRVQFDSPALGQHVEVNGKAGIDGGTAEFAYRITNLFDSTGMVDAMNAMPVGELKVTALPASTLVKFAPEQETVIKEVIGEGLNVQLSTVEYQSKLVATTNITSTGLEATTVFTPMRDALEVTSAQAVVTLTPALVAALQKSAPSPIVLQSNSMITVGIQPLTLPATAPFKYAAPKDPVHVSYEIPSLVAANVPGLAEPVKIIKFFGEADTTLDATGWSATINSDITIQRPNASDALVAAVRCRTVATQKEGVIHVDGKLGVPQLSVVHAEQMLGKEAGEFSQWVGPDGGLTAHFDGGGGVFKGHIHTTLANLHGDFSANLDPQFVVITGTTTKFVLDKSALEKRMNPAPVANAPAPKPEERVRVLDDVPLSFAIKEMKLPLAMAGPDGFDPKSVAMDVGITGGPIRMVSPGEIETTMSDVILSLTSHDLAQGVAFSMTSKADAKSTAVAQPGAQGAPQAAPTAITEPGTVNVTGQVLNLVAMEPNGMGRLQPAKAKLRLDAKAENVPTAVADAVAHMQGLLVAAVGPMMEATFKADDFSAQSGTLEGRVQTSNGFLDLMVQGETGTLSIPTSRPLTAELEFTKPLRDRLLQKIHPIFADIRTTEQPMRAKIPMASLAMLESGTFDIKQLNADLEFTVGKVEFDSGSATMALLKLAGQGQAERRATVLGNVEPIIAKIRAGVVTYDRFAVTIDKWTMVYSGQINLVENTIDVRTELPLAALAHTFRELEGIADKITVPIVTKGKLGEAKPKADFGDVAKQALKHGIGSALGNLLGDR